MFVCVEQLSYWVSKMVVETFCVGVSFVTHQVIPLMGQLVAQITWCSSGVGTKKHLVPGTST